MFITTFDQQHILNTSWISEIHISEPEHNRKMFMIYASVPFGGTYLIAQYKTFNEALAHLKELQNQLKGDK